MTTDVRIYVQPQQQERQLHERRSDTFKTAELAAVPVLGTRDALKDLPGPPRLPRYRHASPSLDRLPSELLAGILQHLEDVSLVALHQTNRDFFYSLGLDKDAVLNAQEARYDAAVTAFYAGPESMGPQFCDTCQYNQPMTAFSISQIIQPNRSATYTCIDHARYWLCPHRSIRYQEVNGAYRSSHQTLGLFLECELDTCSRMQCQRILGHEAFLLPASGNTSYQDVIRTKVLLATALLTVDRNDLPKLINRAFSNDNVKEALSNIPAPICDHYLLSSPQICRNFDPNNIDVEDHLRRKRNGGLTPEIHRRPRATDGECRYCKDLGVTTQLRFLATAATLNELMLELRIVILRGVPIGFGPGTSETKYWYHAKCHGKTSVQLEAFRQRWAAGESTLPYKPTLGNTIELVGLDLDTTSLVVLSNSNPAEDEIWFIDSVTGKDVEFSNGRRICTNSRWTRCLNMLRVALSSTSSAIEHLFVAVKPSWMAPWKGFGARRRRAEEGTGATALASLRF